MINAIEVHFHDNGIFHGVVVAKLLNNPSVTGSAFFGGYNAVERLFLGAATSQTKANHFESFFSHPDVEARIRGRVVGFDGCVKPLNSAIVPQLGR